MNIHTQQLQGHRHQCFHFFLVQKFKSAKTNVKDQADDFHVIHTSMHIIMHCAGEVLECKCVSTTRFKAKCKSKRHKISIINKDHRGKPSGTFQFKYAEAKWKSRSCNLVLYKLSLFNCGQEA